ncbi:MAG: ligase ATP-dependent Dnl1 [Acidobacteriaceae bacterium]|nr:ligase ATP-dependent Dnl1 [Acidobacteriaceae bacterium]
MSAEEVNSASIEVVGISARDSKMALFSGLARLAEELAGTSSRLKKRAAIAGAIAAVEKESPGGEDAGLFALYVAGMPFAEADSRRLNAGGALLSKALLAVSGASDAALTAAYRRHGDLGAAGFDLIEASVRGAAGLTLSEVAEVFGGMALARSTAARLSLVERMLRRASALEVKYLLKLMLGDMRIGVKQSLVEEAIAVAASGDSDSVSVGAVRNAVMLEADLAGAVRRAFAGTLAEARMRLFHPLGFMLASPVESPEEAIARFTSKPEKVPIGKKPKKGKKTLEELEVEALKDAPDREVEMAVAVEAAEETAQARVEAFLEDKYDGIRAQVHCGDADQAGRVAIYSRSREDVTESFPELEEAFAGVTEPLIFDGEILGWDFDEGGLAEGPRALPFAVLGQRIGRKRVSNEMRRSVPVVFMAFDLMYADGDLLLELPMSERRNRLEAVVERLVERTTSPIEVDERARERQAVLFAGSQSEGVPRLMISPCRLVESAEDIERAYADARARANEGVMLKAAGSVYQPGRRGLAWVKLKRELATLDVVVTGAEFGHGRRAGILSDYTFAVRGGGGEFLNVGKAYSGLTDAEIAEMSAWMMAHTLDDQGHFRTVEPLMVLEVAFNNIMRSGRHASGFAMRFPRILKIRTDKEVDAIDTVERVEEVYQSQVDKPVE